MAKAYIKDIWRSIIKGKKRFVSILLITALGVTMLTGIKAACVDLRYSADQFFDAQNLFDINIVSTLGLTDDDIKALTNIEGISVVQGDYSETVYTQIEDKELTAEVKTFQKNGLNIPYLLEGSLPEKTNEIAVTEEYMLDSGKSLGDTLIIEEDTQKTEETATDSSDPQFLLSDPIIILLLRKLHRRRDYPQILLYPNITYPLLPPTRKKSS